MLTRQSEESKGQGWTLDRSALRKVQKEETEDHAQLYLSVDQLRLTRPECGPGLGYDHAWVNNRLWKRVWASMGQVYII